MYKLAHFLRDKLPFVWDVVDWVNGMLFVIRYGRKMKVLPEVLTGATGDCRIVELSKVQTSDIERFFSSQPEESFKYFKPHGFDSASLRKLQKNKAFLAYMIREASESGQDQDSGGGRYVGYFFLRSFFFGKSYLGKLVDHKHRGQGIGKMMCLCAMDIASTLGLRMFETISKDNLSSLYSTRNVIETRIVKEMPDNYLMIEDLKKK